MTRTVLGVFTERTDAEDALNALIDDGYNPKDISIVMKDKREGEELAENTGADVVEGTASGIGVGAILGGLAGLLASFVIPGLGAFFIGGPIAAALGLGGAAASTVSGAATGALAGGLLGALTSFGLSEDEAHVYEERVREGAILVAVPVLAEDSKEVEQILSDFDADQVRSVTSTEDTEEVSTSRRAYGTKSDYRHMYAGAKGGKSKKK